MRPQCSPMISPNDCPASDLRRSHWVRSVDAHRVASWPRPGRRPPPGWGNARPIPTAVLGTGSGGVGNWFGALPVCPGAIAIRTTGKRLAPIALGSLRRGAPGRSGSPAPARARPGGRAPDTTGRFPSSGAVDLSRRLGSGRRSGSAIVGGHSGHGTDGEPPRVVRRSSPRSSCPGPISVTKPSSRPLIHGSSGSLRPSPPSSGERVGAARVRGDRTMRQAPRPLEDPSPQPSPRSRGEGAGVPTLAPVLGGEGGGTDPSTIRRGEGSRPPWPGRPAPRALQLGPPPHPPTKPARASRRAASRPSRRASRSACRSRCCWTNSARRP